MNMKNWVKWNGGDCPTYKDKVYVMLRVGTIRLLDVSRACWLHGFLDSPDQDIIAYCENIDDPLGLEDNIPPVDGE